MDYNARKKAEEGKKIEEVKTNADKLNSPPEETKEVTKPGN